jgi:predicted chitinase
MRKDTVPPNDQRKTTDQEERKIRALEQIAASMAQISSELAQLRVMAANLNLTIARKGRADKSQTR